MSLSRPSPALTRFVLAWFALFVSLSIVSPMVLPTNLQTICTSSGGMKIVVLDDDGVPQTQVSAGMDCPLCASPGAPPPSQLRPTLARPSALAHSLRPIAAAHIASATAPPLPSRGPPHLPV